MTTFKKGEVVRIKNTATESKYGSGSNPGWNYAMSKMVGNEHAVEGVYVGGTRIEIGGWSWLPEDLELVTKGLRPFDAVKVDAISGKIIYDAAVAAGKKPTWALGGDAVMFVNPDGTLNSCRVHKEDYYGTSLNFLSVGEFIERLLHKTEEPLKYKDWVVEIKPGSVTIGCTTVDNATVKRIAAGIGGTSKHQLKDGDCVRVKDNALREWVTQETLARAGVDKRNTGTTKWPALVYRVDSNQVIGHSYTNDCNELTIDQWLERCGGEVITTKQGNVQLNKDSITIGEYELPNDLVKKIGEKLID